MAKLRMLLDGSWQLIMDRCETQNFFNNKGQISDKGQKKAPFHVLSDFYGQNARNAR